MFYVLFYVDKVLIDVVLIGFLIILVNFNDVLMEIVYKLNKL